MDVILLENIRSLGRLGDKVAVKPGYGRNFLIPQGKAVMATADNLAAFEARRADLEAKQAEKRTAAQARGAQLAEIGSVSVTRRAADEGKLFGSVSPADVAAAITAAGVAVDKSEVTIPDAPVRFIGEYEVVVHLHAEVDQTMTLQVVAE